ncbi:MAG: hypothetical protein HN712_16590 [Gemmatimonadetes bacterium]|jgi:hypothetical protein|nr:hypothetical protein [Gemmatimonadota bacterium]MBT7861935.1 hypothetical protein [Gemmatimonadota bacterium]
MANHLNDDDLISLAETRDQPPAHVKACPQCAARLRAFERTLELSAAAPPTMDWNRLQAGAFLHRVRRGIHQQRQPRVTPWWQPALAGATLTVAVLMMFRVMAPIAPAPPIDPSPAAVAQVVDGWTDPQAAAISAGGSDDPLTSEPDMTDAELLSLIDAYLIDTASEDELLLTLGDFNDEEMVAALDP